MITRVLFVKFSPGHALSVSSPETIASIQGPNAYTKHLGLCNATFSHRLIFSGCLVC